LNNLARKPVLATCVAFRNLAMSDHIRTVMLSQLAGHGPRSRTTALTKTGMNTTGTLHWPLAERDLKRAARKTRA
jgi:hypothetical protein